MKQNTHYRLMLVLLFSGQIFAVDTSNLPGTFVPQPVAPKTDRPVYITEEIKPIDLQGLYTIQLAAFGLKKNAHRWVREQSLPIEDIGVARILSKGKESYIVAVGVYEGLLQANDIADSFCQEHNLSGCWARSLERIEAMAEEAKALDEQ